MKDRPIPFASPMVLALLAGAKSQTRRLVKPPRWSSPDEIDVWSDTTGGVNVTVPDDDGAKFFIECPHGKPGDRLWVREAWRVGCWDQETNSIAVDYRADGFARREWLPVPDGDQFFRLWQQSCDDAHAAGEKTNAGFFKWEPGSSPCRWRPSMFMSRWASRILLEVVAVRVERLQDISEADAYAEGVSADMIAAALNAPSDRHLPPAVAGYRWLWESLNGAGSWAANPWVWVVECGRLEWSAA